MFTGLVETIGKITKIQPQGAGKRFEISAPDIAQELASRESISVNGVCLTVVNLNPERFECDVIQETLLRTTLNGLKVGDPVNLERALRLSDRLGGHFVQGHIDGTGEIESFDRDEAGNFRLRIRLPDALQKFVMEKGSIAIDGVSLTIARLWDSGVEIALIPFTAAHTLFGTKSRRDRVNVEIDLLAKYVYRFLKYKDTGDAAQITEDWLRKIGF